MKAILSPAQQLPLAEAASNRGRSTPAWLNLIREAVESADYGTVQIKVHAGEVVQIETTRKIRVPSSSTGDPSKPTAPTEAQQTR